MESGIAQRTIIEAASWLVMSLLHKTADELENLRDLNQEQTSFDKGPAGMRDKRHVSKDDASLERRHRAAPIR